MSVCGLACEFAAESVRHSPHLPVMQIQLSLMVFALRVRPN